MKTFLWFKIYLILTFAQDLLDEVIAVTGACMSLMNAILLLQSFGVIFNL